MKNVFVDTAALIAMGDKDNHFHQQALTIKNELKKSQKGFVTTNAVFFELAGYFSQSQRRSTAIKLIETINKSKKWHCVVVGDTLMKGGLALYKQMSDKDWSLVDCISIVVAEKQGITDIFTTDHHFEQAGFSILLKK